MANKLYITDTILRDGHQSKAATRMPLSDMLPACEALDNIGQRFVIIDRYSPPKF